MKKNWCEIKGKTLYIYGKKVSDYADEEIDIKDIESLEEDPSNGKVFFIDAKNVSHRFEAQSQEIARKWIKSI